MKKIMFNDRFGLTKAVLDGTKTMTRRVIPELLNVEDPDISEWGLTDGGKAMITLYEGGRPTTDIFPMYQPGEVVAVAQKYIDLKDCDAFYEALHKDDPYMPLECIKGEKGTYNKMFVKAAWMPHQIRITNIKVERLQDISEEDCLKEGVLRREIRPFRTIEIKYQVPYTVIYKDNPKDAFAALIDKVSGKGTWESNPYVFAYTFELVK